MGLQNGAAEWGMSMRISFPRPARLTLFGLVAAYVRARGQQMKLKKSTSSSLASESLRPEAPTTHPPGELEDQLTQAVASVLHEHLSAEMDGVDVNTIIREAATKVRTGRGSGIAWLLNLCFNATAAGDREILKRIIEDLIARSAEAVFQNRSGDTATIEITTLIDGEALLVTVTDKSRSGDNRGAGAAFDRLFASKPILSGLELNGSFEVGHTSGTTLVLGSHKGLDGCLILSLPRTGPA